MNNDAVQFSLPGFDDSLEQWQGEFAKQLPQIRAVRNRSGVGVKPMYTPADWSDERYMSDLGFPGEVLSSYPPISDNVAMSSPPNHRGYRFPPEIISHTVWRYHGFTLSLRDIEDLLAERNIIVSYESIRRWCATFGLDYARRLRKRRRALGDRWFLDEVTVSIQGKRQYLWRAVDQDGDVLDILVQSRKDKRAAKRFFRKLLKRQERVPIEMTTDKLRSYAAAKREMMPSVVHCQDKHANNRAEVSHEHTREQERQMRGFGSSAQAQRFLSVHGQVHNLFRVGRHLLRAANYRVLRGRAFAAWQEVACIQ